MGDEQFIMGLRVGLLAALSVTDSWDDYTRGRILALVKDAERPAQAIEAGTAATVKQGAVHESAVPERDASEPDHSLDRKG